MEEVRRGWFVGSTEDGNRDDRGLQLVFCGSTREETIGPDLGKQRQEMVCEKPTCFLAAVAWALAGADGFPFPTPGMQSF